MTPAIRAEFRKLLTVRSTYFITALACLLTVFVGGFAFGYKANPGQLAAVDYLSNSLLAVPQIVGAFAAIVAVLLVAHEYRYSTIIYTFTASNSRSRVLFAKLAALTAFSLAFTLLVSLMLVASLYIGASFSSQDLAAQQLYPGSLLWRIAFVIWGNVLMGMLFGLLFRNLVAAIVSIFILPGTIEGLLELVLKDNTKYLPFNALNQVVGEGALSPQRAALIFLGYAAAFGLAAWILFVRRDAN